MRMRDIVVLLPGITGSVLQKDGKDIWAVSGQTGWKALTSLGSSLQQLMLAQPRKYSSIILFHYRTDF